MKRSNLGGAGIAGNSGTEPDPSGHMDRHSRDSSGKCGDLSSTSGQEIPDGSRGMKQFVQGPQRAVPYCSHLRSGT